MLANGLHIGAAKCASSWLWRVCIEHPADVRDYLEPSVRAELVEVYR